MMDKDERITFHADGVFTRWATDSTRSKTGFWYVGSSELVFLFHGSGPWTNGSHPARYAAMRVFRPDVADFLTHRAAIFIYR